MIAEVIACYGRHLLLRDEHDAEHMARPRGRLLEIVCGDRVQCDFHRGELLVSGVLPRDSLLRRTTLRGRAEALAANITQLAVVVAPVPAPDLFLLDRYLCAAESLGIAPLIVLNKRELAASAPLREALGPYAALGIAVVESSARGDDGVRPLAALLAGHTTMLAGQSGVGKSSLVRLLARAADRIAVGDLVREEEGRHTTTASHLYDCDGGGRIVDSPGVRDFAPAALDLERGALGFREVAELAGRCRFPDCTHMREPDCAVRTAVAAGAIDARRYESYRRLRRLHERLLERRPQRGRAARR